MGLYLYEGPVMEFDTLIVNKWRGMTYAKSENKARSNLVYQYKKKNNRLPSARITLPGRLEVVE